MQFLSQQESVASRIWFQYRIEKCRYLNGLKIWYVYEISNLTDLRLDFTNQIQTDILPKMTVEQNIFALGL